MIDPTWSSADGSVKLFLGDCLEILPELEAGSVDAVVTDPPYGLGDSLRGGTWGKKYNKNSMAWDFVTTNKQVDLLFLRRVSLG